MPYQYLPNISNGFLKSMNVSELEILAQEIRDYLIQTISNTGGHLASNLGVVELTIAYHKVFSSPKDKIVWDVGHQSYVHKLLTGRYGGFFSLRQFGGLSGFPKRSESEHDHFDTGHSSTSISAALGMALARDLQKKKFHVTAVIGDGSMTGGMAFEALNHAGRSKTKLTVILNDNEMSISENVGALSEYFNRIRTAPRYYQTKRETRNVLERIPNIGKPTIRAINRFKDSVKQWFVPGMLFEELGFTYLGPVDGHNLEQLIEAMELAKRSQEPVLLHIITKKGKGYDLAEASPSLFHGPGPFDPSTGKPRSVSEPKFTKAFSRAMILLAEEDPKLVAVTAAMPDGTGLSPFASLYPNRFFDVAIAEQHGVTFAAGLATQGLHPVVAIYSTFLQRSFDQVLIDIAMQQLPVIFILDRAGLVGEDGETHHGVFDLTYLRLIPNLTILVASHPDDVEPLLRFALNLQSPVAIRFPKTNYHGDYPPSLLPSTSNITEPEILFVGKEHWVLSTGPITISAARAIHRLRESEHLEIGLINIRSIKPLNVQILLSQLSQAKQILTLEENTTIGGFGSGILEFLHEYNLQCRVHSIGIPDHFIPHGKVPELLQQLHLDEEHLEQQFKRYFADQSNMMIGGKKQ
jgi:1-deoxy-D-xylulose-5-phosphate synthase